MKQFGLVLSRNKSAPSLLDRRSLYHLILPLITIGMILNTPVRAGSPSFTGLYLGGHLGLGVGKVKKEYRRASSHNMLLQANTFGPLGGFHLGYQKDFGAMVLGIEAGINAAAQKGTNRDLLHALALKLKRKMPGFCLGGHFGVKMGRALLYTKLGLDYSKFQAKVEDGVLTGQKTKSLLGSFIGFGVSTMVNKSMMLGAEGIYTFFGKKNLIHSMNNTTVLYKVQPNCLDFKIRLSFKL